MKEATRGIWSCLKNSWSCLKGGFADLVFPSNIYCICCGNLINDSRPYALCDSCVRTLNWANSRTCEKCGKILGDGYEYDLCTDCCTLEHSFEKGFACVEYGRVERDLILNFKYKDKAYLGHKMAEIMVDRIIAEDLQFDLILPVPMFKKKERKRGYNQAVVLAKDIAVRMEKPFSKKLLLRMIDTEPMNSLGAEERRGNIRKAFTIREGWDIMLQGKAVLLVDDIYTTGSTMDACSDVLLSAGVSKVYVFAFAAGSNLTN